VIEGYVYKIIFLDGCWYWGTSKYKGTPPEKDGYYGSPVTHKHKWREPHSKLVLKTFSNEGDRLDYEEKCILPDLNNPRCLNEHARRCFSRETHERNVGVPRPPEVREKISKAHRGRKLSPEHRQKLREADRPPILPETIAKRVQSRKGYRHSDETKTKIAKSNTGRPKTLEEIQKISDSVKGFKWFNNGVENIQARSHPGEGWREGRILSWDSPKTKGMRWYHRGEECRMFLKNPGEGWMLGRPRAKGKKYYNNGTDHVLAYECPGEGWVLGRLSRK
jgi:hypothetical protein